MHLYQKLEKSDAIFVLCSLDTRVANYAADLYLQGYGDWLIISGGFGKLTKDRFNKPEAQIFKDIAILAGVPENKIIIEDKSTNTGENISLTFKLLGVLNKKIKSIILIHKPYMERRTFATFVKQWPNSNEITIQVTSPKINYEDYFTHDINKQLVINVMVGDLQRIHEYPRLGYQIEQQIPKNVWQSYENLVTAGFTDYLI